MTFTYASYAAVAVLATALIALSATLSAAASAVAARARTVARWMQFFPSDLVRSRFWCASQGSFAPPPDARGMPATLVARFAYADPPDQLLGVLKFLTPVTVSGWR